MPKVSVIIPTYNRGYIVREAIESVLAQTFTDLELIVVDDGSTDDTAEKIAAIRDSRVRYIHQANAGVSAARNRAFAESRGEIIAFLDSDDLWKPEKLFTQLSFLEKHPEAGAVFSDGEGTDITGAHYASFMKIQTADWPTFSHPELVLPKAYLQLMLLKTPTIHPSSLVARSRLVEAAGPFDTTLKCAEDWDFFLRASKLASFGYIDRSLVLIRPQPDATHVRFVDKRRDISLLANERRQIPLRDREMRRASTAGIVRHARLGIWLAQTKGQTRAAVAIALRAFALTGSPEMLMRCVWVCLPRRFAGKVASKRPR